ncbi:MAG: FAD-dependent oxidoreductase [Bacteroidetes bacterium]|nr:FAD-dependent oxidoreductase [Bacteroidota bacterium]
MVTLSINNQKIEVNEGITLLTAIEGIGIKVPTLCHHKALIPYGACRLCVVEVQVPERAASLQASCSYPVISGITVTTDNERIRNARKIVAELLLVRCPDSETIKKIADEYGVKEPRIKKKNEDCILCGLCVRMCEQRMGRSAIGFTGRGPRRKQETPFGKHNEMCWICGACNFICPVGKKVQTFTSDRLPIPIPDSFNMGLNERAVVNVLYPQAIPNKPAIDNNTCLHLNYDVCGICKEVCEAKAIDYEQKEQKLELNVGAIILSPGYNLFNPDLKPDYGYGKFKNVITALEFERILSASGPFQGKIIRPSDKTDPEKIAWIQCVGSRDHERDYCSAVCCMYATKEAIIAKEHEGEKLKCDIFYMDIRAFSKGFEEYYIRAQKLGVNYIRCRPLSIKELPETNNLIIDYLTEDDRKLSGEYDLVILSTGLTSPGNAKKLAKEFGLELNKYDFCETSSFAPVDSPKEGVFITGVFTEPKDIPESVMQGSAAAARILSLLYTEKGKLVKEKVYPPEKDVKGEEPRVGVFVCHCGRNIGGVISVPEVVGYVKTLPDVVHAEDNLFTCSAESGEKIKQAINEHNLNRVIVASCTPRTHEPLFQSIIQEAGLNPYLFEMANIRDQCTWVHMHEPKLALQKAKDLVRMAVAKARFLEPLYKRKVKIYRDALVIGGGVSGITSAINLAEQYFEVYLLEKSDTLGGNLKQVKFLLNGDDPQKKLNSLIDMVKHHPKIHIFTNSQIVKIDGSVGNFSTEFKSDGNVHTINHGVVIVATGAEEYKPTEYMYGQDKKIITQTELEENLAKGSRQLSGQTTNHESSVATPQRGTRHKQQTVVMIQCVGSRDEKRPYCSRICCQQAIKNALLIKEKSPDTDVFILYRDIRTYGFNEGYYTKAREKDVRFIAYNADKKPEVEKINGQLKVSVYNPVLDAKVNIKTDLLILSTGVIPRDDAKDLAQKLKVPLTKDGFFLEAHMKLRPVDFANDGVFLCGLAHFPKTVDESIAQSLAASSRASTIISKEKIELAAVISNVVDENCDGCAYCIDPCPYKALTLFEYMREGSIKKTVEVDELKCKGCGTCMATCPKKGIYVRNFTLEHITAQVEAALQTV